MIIGNYNHLIHRCQDCTIIESFAQSLPITPPGTACASCAPGTRSLFATTHFSLAMTDTTHASEADTKKEHLEGSGCVLPHQHGTAAQKAAAALPETHCFEAVSQVFKQLSDPCRCRIFLLLCHSEQCVINIAALMKMSSPAVAHHLKLLKISGLVQTRREGKEVFYRACDTELARSLHHMIEHVMHLSCLASAK